MVETKSLEQVLMSAKGTAELAQAKLLQVYAVASLLGEFNSLKKDDPPVFCSHDVILTMVLFTNQLNEASDDLAGLIGDLRRALEQNQGALAAVE